MKSRLRSLCGLLALLVVFTLLITACGKDAATSGTSKTTAGTTNPTDPAGTETGDTHDPLNTDPSDPDATTGSDATTPDGSTVNPPVNKTSGNSNNTPGKTDKPITGSTRSSSVSNVPTTASKPSGGYADDPIVNLGGYKFTFASPWMPSKLTSSSTLFERLFFERKEEVEEAYNCEIKIINLYGSPETIQPLIMAKKKIADVIEMSANMWLPNSQAGYLTAWSDIKGININDDRWIDAYTGLSTYKGKVWGLQFTRPPEVRACVFFNKTLLKANGVNPDSLYDLVNQKKWDFNKLKEYAIACTKDTNKDGKIDTYGITGDPGSLATYLTAANGGRLVTLQNNRAVASFSSQNCLNALNFVNDLVNTSKVYYTVDQMWSQNTWNDNKTNYTKDVFLAGKAAFLFGESYVGNQVIKPNAKNLDYGMLPIPIGPNGSGYVSPSTNARSLCLTSTNAKSADIGKTVTVLNALARPMKGYEGESWWLDDVQADYFQNNDKKSIQMYQLCLNSMMVDLGDGVQQLNFDYLQVGVFDTVFWKNATPSAALKGMEGKYTAAINAVYNK